MVDRGILSLLQQLTKVLTERMEAFQYNIALQELQNFVWHELCDYYIEIAKTKLYTPRKSWMRKSAQYTLYTALWILTTMYSPFAPHITEEIRQHLFNKTILEANWPVIDENLIDKEAERSWKILKEAISTIRKVKSHLRLPLNAEIPNAIIHYENESSKEILERLRIDIKEVGKVKRVIILKKAKSNRCT
ncbi:MAG: class I tRNA ligase family protein [Candidatus Bathyarchaeota archaeon]|nr:class I tRNA ligase family protein [Candidatus Bathyarchaeota archaeon]MDH5746616.1 class I tRNA ligase family protein [Candidatus Bathyarchaeota archaeon]